MRELFILRGFAAFRHVQLVCVQHYEERYGKKKIQDLQKEFQKLGGEIKGDVAIIQGEASNKLLEMLDIICRGLPVFSVILKDLNLKKRLSTSYSAMF